MKKLIALLLALAMLSGMACGESVGIDMQSGDEPAGGIEIESPEDGTPEELPREAPAGETLLLDAAGDASLTPEEGETLEQLQQAQAGEAVEREPSGAEGDAETAGAAANAADVVEIRLSGNAKQTVYIGTSYRIVAPDETGARYKSSNVKVAKVSGKGVLTLISKGSAKITVTLKSGKKLKLTLTVYDRPIELTVKKDTSATAYLGAHYRIVAPGMTVLGYKSNAKKIAAVDAEGVVTPRKAGKARITIRVKRGNEDGEEKLTLKLTVKKSPKLKGLKANRDYLIAGTVNNVTFTVNCPDADATVLLKDGGGNALGKMRDDGKKGDKKAKDGVFTLKLKDLVPEAPADLKFCAEAGSSKSNTLTLLAFLEGTKENAPIAGAQVDEVSAAVLKAAKRYTDASGYVKDKDVEKALSAVMDALKPLKKDGVILQCDKGGGSVYIKLASGIAMIYQPALEGRLAGGENVRREIDLVMPSPDLRVMSFISLSTKINDTVGALLKREGLNKGMTYPKVSEINLEYVKRIGRDKLVVWFGHGTFHQCDKYHPKPISALITGEVFDVMDWLSDYTKYLKNCIQVVPDGTTGKKLICVAHKFFEDYCMPMNNDIIFLNACCSAMDPRLAEAMLGQGAAAVLGCTDIAWDHYTEEITENILMLMTLIDPDTHDYFTLRKALEKVTQYSGGNDREWAKRRGYRKEIIKQSKGAAPKVFPEMKVSEDETRLVSAKNQRFRVTDKAGELIPIAKVKLKGKRETYSVDIVDPRTATLPAYCYCDGSPNPEVDYDENGHIRWENTNNIPISNRYLGTYHFSVSAKNFRTIEETNVVDGSKEYWYKLEMEGSCVGKVTDKYTHKALYRVRVESKHAKTGVRQIVYTDKDGRYQLDLDTPGKYTVNFSLEGYGDETETITLTQDRPTASLVVKLGGRIELSGYMGKRLTKAINEIEGLKSIDWSGNFVAYSDGNLTLVAYPKDADRATIGSITLNSAGRYTLFGISIGMSADEAKALLKKVKNKEDYYESKDYISFANYDPSYVYFSLNLTKGKVSEMTYGSYTDG